MSTADPDRPVMLISPYGIENRGVRYIAAVLRSAGFRPVLVLMKRWINNQISPPTEKEQALLLELAQRLNPLLIGIGFGAPYFKVVTALTQQLKQVVDSPILWGGVYPTVCPEACIEHADMVCVGEGEQPVLDLCRALSSGDTALEIPNLWIRSGGDVHKHDPRPLIQDVDALPMPEYGMSETVFIEDDQLRHVDPISETAEYRIYPTRGCPYACSYCNNSILRKIYEGKGKYYRVRSVESVISELETARQLLPRIRRIKFDGDVFAFPGDWIQRFSEAYAERIGLPFELLTYPGELSADDLRHLKSAGLCKVQTGIQSGSDDEVSTVYKRTSTGSKIHEFSRLTHEIGVPVVYDLIFDNPLAKRDDKRRMIELLLTLDRPFKVYLYSLTVFPKTGLARDLLEQGLITPDDIEGQATKSFEQFRLSLDYPRSAEDVYWICLAILSAKSFIPRAAIRRLMKMPWLMAHPAPLRVLAQAADLAKNAVIAADMLLHGELTMFKIRQYGAFRRMISQ
ncbi:MAG: B12-binding domain-containing radical SAM protein [Verrucomicrobia bacterium]|jgi:anaerobic magnesium-protoporphyrin IX monomethyl ester cyclase|nr:B12-binding domain-containing radical SAM protein [Verrucomicrobiota bacterium]